MWGTSPTCIVDSDLETASTIKVKVDGSKKNENCLKLWIVNVKEYIVNPLFQGFQLRT